jgi:hypothetical protein
MEVFWPCYVIFYLILFLIFQLVLRFKLLHHEYIEFSPIGLKDNVAQICVLEVF